jgi:hypothetical protein
MLFEVIFYLSFINSRHRHMYRTLLLISIILLGTTCSLAQNLVSPNTPIQKLSSESGYITINEFTGGFGLGVVDAPYAK